MKYRYLIPAILSAALLGGCAGPSVMEVGFYAPPGTPYVAPTYEMPGPGYSWQFNANYSRWGWHHPDQGWHHP